MSTPVIFESRTEVAQSLQILFNGVAVSRASEAPMLSAVCTQVRGDWKWQKDPGIIIIINY